VREALIELEHWGYVQRIPNRETRVTKLTHDDIVKIFQVRVPWKKRSCAGYGATQKRQRDYQSLRTPIPK